VEFLLSLGLTIKDIGRLLTHCPNIFGYSIENRLQPSIKFLQSLGIQKDELQRVVTLFPHVLCRKADKVFRPVVEHLRNLGFSSEQVATIAAGYPPVLIISIHHSLQPKLDFLVKVMRHPLADVVDYPAYFSSSLRRTIEPRYRKLQQRANSCSLSDMLDCNNTEFARRFPLANSPVLPSATVLKEAWQSFRRIGPNIIVVTNGVIMI
jgi:mTERF domain-containing protein